MSHAFLLLAHNDAPQLYNLVKALYSPHSNIYIHVDAKSTEFMNKSKIKELISMEHVYFVPRIKTYWGGFSLVKATLILLREAIKDNNNERFHLLSGVDYPIKSINKIRSFFNKNNNNYLTYIPEESNKRYFIDRYYFYDNDYISTKNLKCSIKKRIIHSILIFIQRITWFLVQILQIPIRKKINIKYYHGSQWFSFTREAVNYILNYVEHNPWILKRFNYTACSDESFFTMILMNSDKFKNTIINDDLRLRMPDGSLNRGGYVLTEKDIEHIKKSPALFARKFTTLSSSKLISYINESIINNESD